MAGSSFREALMKRFGAKAQGYIAKQKKADGVPSSRSSASTDSSSSSVRGKRYSGRKNSK